MKTDKVWDIFVRIFHWSLVTAIIVQLITAEAAKNAHVYVGYFIIVLVLARILWGFVGSRHARFTDFIYSPREVMAYLKSLFSGHPKRYIGHNPAGGAMVIALLLCLLLTTSAGLKTLGAEGRGPLAQLPESLALKAYADGGQEGADHASAQKEKHIWQEIHEFLVGILIFLIVLHIVGVIVSSWLERENLILAMITGKKERSMP